MDLTRDEIMERMARCHEAVESCRAYMADMSHALIDRQAANHGEVDNLVAIMVYQEDLDRIDDQ